MSLPLRSVSCRRPLLRILLVAALSAAASPVLPVLPLEAQAVTDPGDTDTVLEDRILAVVDDDPILDSDVERLVALGLVSRGSEEPEEDFQRRLLEALIEQRLRFHAIERFGFEQIPVEAVEEELAAIRSRYPDAAAFQNELERLGLNERGLRQLLSRQLMVLTYIEERLGPRIFIRSEEIESYYRNTLGPRLEESGATAPPLEEVRDSIRPVLREQRLNQEIRKWSDELRDKADIRIFPEPPAELPPVIGSSAP